MRDQGSSNNFKGEEWCPETDLNRRHADFQAEAKGPVSRPCETDPRQTGYGTSKPYPQNVKPNNDEKRGDTNLDPAAFWSWFEEALEYQTLVDAFRKAVWALPDHLRVRIVEATLAALRPDMPEFLPPDLFILEAEDWAQVAGWQLNRIILWAIWQHAPDDLRSSFLAYANGKEAA